MHSVEEILDVCESNVILDEGVQSVHIVSQETASVVSPDPCKDNFSKSTDTVLSTKTASDLNKSDKTVTSTDTCDLATGNNK